MAHARSGAVAVVGQGLDDDGDPAGTVSFVNDFFDGGRPFLQTGPPSDGPVDVLVRNVLFFGLVNGFGQARVLGRIGSLARGDGNQHAMDGKNLPAFLGRGLFLSLDNGSSSHIGNN
jgi:hypothetical protein